ncbi:efflux transporter outer membrane subunit [Dickeya solani]|uniref:Protein CyaE n=1 Tax=Dickeya solani TaxID=1089444 RepID=A0ABU4EJH5_9GAMM|nr:efflux transporter outer membrane subunit [Dickeya solani]MCA6999570.1 efflux transporter outer membrane subunit [Dickeya solani]MCZ0819770.1 efflux transporter outer membrane subunit [Dickeya solani]MDV6993782.1 efflux transporter outer membrane subunit [Dickeya solani]MDV7005138.1 efflux transporter outer membrane subunit [Dickeya solani]MDV7038955.1 efflux transporter outer membrane subunit [Dickeya solani]
MRVIMTVLTGAMLLSGCSLDPHYQRPSAPVPDAWPQGAAYQVTATTRQPADDIPWREVLVDDRLRQVVDMALSDNRDLRKAIADVEAARAQLGEKRAALLPTINAGMDGDRSRSLSSSGNGTVLSSSYGANLSTSAFTLDLFGKNRSLTGAAREAYLSSAATATSTRLTLIADTSTAWVALATARSNLALARQTMESAGQSLAVTRSRLRNGVASAVDVAQSETVYQQARADVASALTTDAQNKNALDLLAGRSVPEALLPADVASLAPAVKPVAAGISSAALLRRPDVQAAEHTLKSANANIGAARAAFFPSITLTASNGLSSEALSSLFSGGAHVWSLAPSVSLPIFDGGANLSALRYAEAEKQGYVASYEKTLQTAFREVADALARKGTIDEQQAAQRDYVTAAERSYQLASNRYRAGVDTYLNVLDAQRTLYSARQTLLSLEQSRLDNLITLYNVLGGGVK